MLKHYTICKNPIKRAELIRAAIDAGFKTYSFGISGNFSVTDYQKYYLAQENPCFYVSFMGVICVDSLIHESGLLNMGYIYYHFEQMKQALRQEETKKNAQLCLNALDVANLKGVKYTLNKAQKEVTITMVYKFN